MDIKFLEEAQTLAQRQFQDNHNDDALVFLDVNDGKLYLVFLLFGEIDCIGLRTELPESLAELSAQVDLVANQMDKAVMHRLPADMQVKRFYSPEYNEAALRRNPVTLAAQKGDDGEVVFKEVFPHQYIFDLEEFDRLEIAKHPLLA